MKYLSALAVLFCTHCFAQETVSLYSGKIPNSIESPDEESIRDPKDPFPFLLDVSRPLLTFYRAHGGAANTPAVVILPGGSYRGVSIVKEGRDVALAFNEMGVSAFVLKYRTPNSKWMRDRTRGALQDVQQAMRVVREHASEWGIDNKRVGVVGFSAGGHLAANAVTKFSKPVTTGSSAIVRPDFAVLLYPVISMKDPLTHATSRDNLLGDAPSKELIEEYSLENGVTENTPPTFLVHAADDKSVKAENTLRFFEALKAHDVSVEMHIYPRGGHGFGLNNATTADRWIDRCRNWLVSQGMLEEKK